MKAGRWQRSLSQNLRKTINKMGTEKTKMMVEKANDKSTEKPGSTLKTEKFGRTMTKPVNVKKPK